MDELFNKLDFHIEGEEINNKYVVQLPYELFSNLYIQLDGMVDAERDSDESSLTIEDGADITYYVDGYKITMKGNLDESEYFVIFEKEE